MIKDSQKRKLLFRTGLLRGVNTKEVLERLIQVLGQHGIKVADDEEIRMKYTIKEIESEDEFLEFLADQADPLNGKPCQQMLVCAFCAN